MQTQRGNTALGPVQIGIILTGLITAGIHLYLVQMLVASGRSGTLFLLNGLGYLALLAALFLPLPILQKYRALIRYVLIGYTILTIVLWVILGMRDMIGYTDKLAELLLVVLLWFDRSRDA